MSGLFKAAKKISKIGSRVLGASLGFAVGGPVGAAIGYKAGDTVARGIGGKKAAPVVLPLPDEEEIARAQRRALAARVGRSGRSSTILSGNDEPLG